MTALTAMTDVLPVVVVAGTTTMVAKSMFPSQPRRRTKRRKSRRSNRYGNFNNVGF